MANKTIDIDVLDEGSSVTVEIPAAMYAQINKLIIDLLPKDMDSYKILMESVNASTSDDNVDFFKYKVLFGLTLLIEEAAREQGKIKKTTLDVETGEMINTEKNPPAPQSQSKPE